MFFVTWIMDAALWVVRKLMPEVTERDLVNDRLERYCE